MHIGDQVWAYNASTHTMELEPVQHVWINHDNDLLDLTIQPQTKVPEAAQKDAKPETIHTTRKHPFLTVERGFLPANALKPGMYVIEANGHIGVITKWVVVPGQATMYNLTVAHDHTYAVGVGQWVVHNANCGKGLGQFFDNPELLRDKAPEEVGLEDMAQQEGWNVEKLGQGTHAGQGTIVREVNENGNLTGRMIQWHPGGGSHGPEPYWKVSSPRTGTIRIGPQFPPPSP